MKRILHALFFLLAGLFAHGGVMINPYAVTPTESIHVDAIVAALGADGSAISSPSDVTILGSWPGASITSDGSLTHTEVMDGPTGLALPYNLAGVGVIPHVNKFFRFNPANRPAPSSNTDFIYIQFPAGFKNYTADSLYEAIVPDDVSAMANDNFGGNNGDEILIQWRRNDNDNGPGLYTIHGNAYGGARMIPREATKDYVCWSVRDGALIYYFLRYDTNTFSGAGFSNVSPADQIFNQITDYIGFNGPDYRVSRQTYNWTTKPLVMQPFPLPAPSSLDLVVTSSTTARLTWFSKCSTFELDEWDGSSWTTIETFFVGTTPGEPDSGRTNTFLYDVTGLEPGDVRKYRLRAIYGFGAGGDSIYSAYSAESNEIEIDASSPLATDGFNSPESELSLRDGWEARVGDITLINQGGTDGQIYAGNSGNNVVEYTAITPAADHAVEFTIDTALTDDSGLVGGAIRIQANGDSYQLMPASDRIYLLRRISGSVSFTLQYFHTTTPGDHYRFAATGAGSATRLTIYQNGTPIETGIDPGSGNYLDGGGGGVATNGVSGVARLDDWKLFDE